MKPYKAYIFDMNGTIIDDMAYHTESWLDILARLGHPVTEDEFARQFYGKTNDETLREVMGADFPKEQITKIALEKEIAYQKIYKPYLAPVPGFSTFLQIIQAQGCSAALATSANRFNIDFVLQGLGLENAFAAVVGAEDIEQSKPHPEIFLNAAAALGAAAEDCLVFEDSLMGLAAAQRAHMDAYAILTTLEESEALALPNVVGASANFLDLIE